MDSIFKLQGFWDASLKGKTLRIPIPTEEDILIIKHMLLEEVREQNKNIFLDNNLVAME